MTKAWINTIADTKFFVVGGAGFIGAHFVDYLLAHGASAVTIYDNFSSGREWHGAPHAKDRRFAVARGNVEDLQALRQAMDGHQVLIHLASNPDIARAATDPEIDFWQGTALTHFVLEAMRATSAKRILYASGSGVYGDFGEEELSEEQGGMLPISTYGASKLAGEAMIASYASMFGLSGCAFRFGNVVGPRQTHGVGLDFARSLLKDSRQLRILGDGSQRKSYVYVTDIVAAAMRAHTHTETPYRVYNVATGDTITVREIAEVAVQCVGLPPGSVRFDYTGGDRGWKGDVPVVRLATGRIRGLGWAPTIASREAMRRAIDALLPELRAGRM